MVVAWHGGSPRVSTNYIEPKGNTFSPENPRKWVLTGSNLALLMSILSKAEAKMMSAELPLSTRTRWTVLLATTARITKGSSWGCWHPSRSESENVMDVSSQGSLDTASTSLTSSDLMLSDGPSWLSWIPLLLQILPRSDGFPLNAVGAELLSTEVVAVAVELEPDSEPDFGPDPQVL